MVFWMKKDNCLGLESFHFLLFRRILASWVKLLGWIRLEVHFLIVKAKLIHDLSNVELPYYIGQTIRSYEAGKQAGESLSV